MVLYDAAYVALARWLSLPLVTADETPVRRLAGDDADVRWLGKEKDSLSSGMHRPNGLKVEQQESLPAV